MEAPAALVPAVAARVSRIVRRTVPAAAPPIDRHLHPLLGRLYAARNVRSTEELDYRLARLHSPFLLHDMQRAVELAHVALRDRQRILIIGDFDVDGATSSALVVAALRDMGAAEVDYLVPNRFEYGYGLTPAIVAVAAGYDPGLIITVDNGISSIDGVQAARDLGIKVLVTDHHLPGKKLPEADAIVNPNQPADQFPGKCLAGVGVAFHLMMALRMYLRDQGWFATHAIDEPNLAAYLDLVALGTVADLVPLQPLNRVLVEQGLKRIRAGRCRLGIGAILESAGRRPDRVTAADLGFTVGPRLNAAGRLDDMSIGIACLLAEQPAQARAFAEQLDDMNRERKEIESDMKVQAFALVNKLQLDEACLPNGLCLYDAGWHQGVVGIVASRVKEKFHRPVIAFARSGSGMIKGSGRSVRGLHLRDALEAIATRIPGLIERFGGHAMAAGLSMAEEKFDAFQEAFEQELSSRLDSAMLTGMIESDGQLESRDFRLEIAELLRNGGPWGQGFPEPRFDGDFTVVSQRVLGGKHLKLVVCPIDSRKPLDAIAFFQAQDHGDLTGANVRLAFSLDSNEYRGAVSLQLRVEYIECSDATTPASVV